MRWTSRGAHVVLQHRAAALTLNRWNAFWRKISLYGVMIEADRTIVPPDPLHHLGITPHGGVELLSFGQVSGKCRFHRYVEALYQEQG